ncbi:hypothetical protein ACQY0O_007225 [Thecaphora frezii]
MPWYPHTTTINPFFPLTNHTTAPPTMQLRFLLTLPLALLAMAPAASKHHHPAPYLTLPPTPALPAGGRQGRLSRPDGSSIWYIDYHPIRASSASAHRPPVTFLHGGFASSDYWGLQIEHTKATHRVLAIDSRGHGRSTEAKDRPITYDAMTHDVVAVLDHLGIDKTLIVGWSDGGILGFDLAMNYSSRTAGVFSFGGTYSPANINTTMDSSVVFNRYLARAEREFATLNPRGAEHWDTFSEKMDTMWATLPAWNHESFNVIDNGKTPVWIVDGAEEEAVNRTVPAELHEWIPGSGLAILPLVSHFAFIQDPPTFNDLLASFLRYYGGI